MKKIFISILTGTMAVLVLTCCNQEERNQVAQNKVKLDSLVDVWKLSSENNGISWDVKGPHSDHIEFSGLQVSGIITYGINESGNLILKKKVVWPMLRTIPNDTHASLIYDFDDKENSAIKVNGKVIRQEKPIEISLDGTLRITSVCPENISIIRTLSPSINQPAIIESISITNTSENIVELEVIELDYLSKTNEKKGVFGSYYIRAQSYNHGIVKLAPGENYIFYQVYSGTIDGEPLHLNTEKEIKKRKSFIDELNNSLILEVPNANIVQMFNFAKLRGTESIFATKGGLMHGPGGSRYYAAIWANDQAEYINPFFPFLGNENGNESAINSFRHFARFMNDDFEPIPSSIIAEGTDIWNGAGDRGDAAMIAYGASRFALAYGKPAVADSLLPLIKWCLEYCERQMLPEGVIASDCDELENRFPAGKANLTTNILAYSGYIDAANVLNSLNRESELAETYRKKASELRASIENYFGANVGGFETYQYFEGNKKLRSWICIPLTAGVFERKDETLRALLSDKLWNKNGIFTEAGDSTFWDRATLYAFRGIFKAGEVDLGMEYFKYYTQKRLLGEHVPYAVEAWPEGNQRHLSAESGLYCRVITEGLFGIEPTGLKSFKCAPRLPHNWDYMKLKNIKAFQTDFNIEVKRNNNISEVSVIQNGEIVYQSDWDGESELEITLK